MKRYAALGGDFLRFSDLTADRIMAVLSRAVELHSLFKAEGRQPQLLAGRRVAVMWDAGGFRNRAGFELGIRLMGGIDVEIPGPLAGKEAPIDVGGYLSSWFDAIVVRTREFSDLESN